MLKWADHRDASRAAAVSSLYFKACEAAELWIHYCDYQGVVSCPAPGTSYKDHFRTHQLCLTDCYFLSGDIQCAYNCVVQSWRELSRIPLLVASWNCSYVLTANGVLLCGGGARNTNEAWLYSPDFGQVTKLPSMNCIRAGHGCVNYHHIVYVFGGSGSRSSCEKFASNQWTLMSQMVFEHAWFTPAVQSSLIYLCGGCTSHCEVFHPSTEQCSALPVSLPTDTEACAFACSECIVVLQRGRVTKIRGGEIESQETWLDESPWGNMSPVVVGKVAYLPRTDEKLLRRIEVGDTVEVQHLPVQYSRNSRK